MGVKPSAALSTAAIAWSIGASRGSESETFPVSQPERKTTVTARRRWMRCDMVCRMWASAETERCGRPRACEWAMDAAPPGLRISSKRGMGYKHGAPLELDIGQTRRVSDRCREGTWSARRTPELLRVFERKRGAALRLHPLVKPSHWELTIPRAAMTKPKEGMKSSAAASILCQESPRNNTGVSTRKAAAATPPRTMHHCGSRRLRLQMKSTTRDRTPLAASRNVGCNALLFIWSSA